VLIEGTSEAEVCTLRSAENGNVLMEETVYCEKQ